MSQSLLARAPKLTSSIKRRLQRELRAIHVDPNMWPTGDGDYLYNCACGSKVNPSPEARAFHERRCRLRTATAGEVT
ncbi:MAG TPA: hypothetical protein VJ891_09655 [Casimicrobiaceae bacterium]|nr:hypothetical protein [Casimicrobiaceae bacterium]